MNEISTGLLQEIKTNFPDLSWKSSKYISVGFDNYVIILDNKIVFRIPKMTTQKNPEDEIKLLKQLAGKISSKIPSYTFIAKTVLISNNKRRKTKTANANDCKTNS